MRIVHSSQTLLLMLVLANCSSAPPSPNNSAPPEADTDEVAYEEDFGNNLIGVLYAYDKTKGTSFKDTPIVEIEGTYALSLLEAANETFPGDDPLLQHADKFLRRPGAKAAIADVPDSPNLPSAFLFIPTPIGEEDYYPGVVLNLGQPIFYGFEHDVFSDSPTLAEFPSLKDAQPEGKHVVFFGSSECMAASRMLDLLSRLPEATQERIYFVDGFKDKDLAKSFGLVPAVPTLLVLDPAQGPQDIFYGGGDLRQVRHFMARNGLLDPTPELSTRIRSHTKATPVRTVSTVHHIQSEDLHGLDLRGASLFRATFGGVDLRGVDFTGADLRNAIFAHSNLEGANLEKTRLDDVRFWNSICPDGSPSKGEKCPPNVEPEP